MITGIDGRYRPDFRDGYVTRAEAKAWMDDKAKGVSQTEEYIMWQNLDEFEFEPGVKEEVETFLAGEAAKRYERGPSLFDRIWNFFCGDQRDYDQDGIKDSVEQKLNTNPFRADTDGDGLKDSFEVAQGSDPGAFIR